MVFLGSIFIPTSSWIWVGGALSAAVFLLLLWSYRRAPGIGTAQRIAFCLKLLGVLILVLCLTEPLWSGRRAKSGANLFVVIADNSGGIGNNRLTARQLAAIWAIARQAEIPQREIRRHCMDRFGRQPEFLSKQEASEMIDTIQDRR